MHTEKQMFNNEKIPQKINKIYFLVHPGFLSDERTKITEDDETSIYHELLDKYINEAKNLKDDEIMIALTHTLKNNYKSDIEFDMQYITNLQKLKNILGKRLIVLSSDFDFFNDNEAMLAIKNLARQRGYTFGENVLSEAYGETLGACVDRIAQNLNETGNFVNKTKIRPELTDAHLLNNADLDNLKTQIQNEHNKLKF